MSGSGLGILAQPLLAPPEGQRWKFYGQARTLSMEVPEPQRWRPKRVGAFLETLQSCCFHSGQSPIWIRQNDERELPPDSIQRQSCRELSLVAARHYLRSVPALFHGQ